MERVGVRQGRRPTQDGPPALDRALVEGRQLPQVPRQVDVVQEETVKGDVPDLRVPVGGKYEELPEASRGSTVASETPTVHRVGKETGAPLPH